MGVPLSIAATTQARKTKMNVLIVEDVTQSVVIDTILSLFKDHKPVSLYQNSMQNALVPSQESQEEEGLFDLVKHFKTFKGLTFVSKYRKLLCFVLFLRGKTVDYEIFLKYFSDLTGLSRREVRHETIRYSLTSNDKNHPYKFINFTDTTLNVLGNDDYENCLKDLLKKMRKYGDSDFCIQNLVKYLNDPSYMIS